MINYIEKDEKYIFRYKGDSENLKILSGKVCTVCNEYLGQSYVGVKFDDGIETTAYPGELINLFNEYGTVENNEIKFQLSEQGSELMFKSLKFFKLKKGVCYAALELPSSHYSKYEQGKYYSMEDLMDLDLSQLETYTYLDFIKEAENNEALARNCFEMIGDMCLNPYQYFEIGIRDGWFIQCEKCNYIFDHHDKTECPKCKEKISDGNWHFADEEV